MSWWPVTFQTLHLPRLALVLLTASPQLREIRATGDHQIKAFGDAEIDSVIAGLSEVVDDRGGPNLSELLPAEVRKALPKVFEHYGHPEAFLDDETGAFLHQLLPEVEGPPNSKFNSSWPGGLLDDIVDLQHRVEWPQHSQFNSSRLESPTPEHVKQDKLVDQQRGREEALRHKQEEQVVADQRRAEFAESRRKQEELMHRLAERREAAAQRQSRMRAHNAQLNERVEQLLKQAHEQIEADTHGFRNAPFWDDFFGNATTRHQWNLLSMEALQPTLEAATLRPGHRVLVLEPSASFGLAGRLANSMLERGIASAAGHAYGSEPDEGVDMVLELGLLDAMAMGGGGELEGRSRLTELRGAAGRVSNLLKPNGCWVSVSSVPPALRLPLLERLVGGTFQLPSEAADRHEHEVAAGSPVGTHTIILGTSDLDGGSIPEANGAPKLRGTVAGGLETGEIANLLLYGHRAPRVFAYRMNRGDGAWLSAELKDTEQGPLESIIAAQREAIRDDL